MSAQTPGTWVYDPECGYVRNEDDWPIGEMGETGLPIADEHARIRADRTLIAAAPELLAALRDTHAHLQSAALRGKRPTFAVLNLILRTTEAAIAKARGQS